MKNILAAILILKCFSSLATCDSCPVGKDHSTYVSVTSPVGLFLNPYADFATIGLSGTYQAPSGIRVGLDIFTAQSLSNVIDSRPLTIAITPTVGITYKEWNKFKIYQKTSLGISSHVDSYTSTITRYDRDVRNRRLIASTEMAIGYKVGKHIKKIAPTISYSLGFAGDLGVIPMLSESPSYGYSNRQSSFFEGFYTCLSIGINIHRKPIPHPDF